MRITALLLIAVFAAGCGHDTPEDGGKPKTHPAAGHGHAHDTPHHGILGHLKDGKKTRHIELKLHDDKGDLELWIYRGSLDQPFDVSPDTNVVVKFPALEREAALQVRNRGRNEDEDGTAQMRDGKTNYFIFPGHTDADASWLKGKGFSADVVVEVRIGDKVLTSETFTLKPHVH